MVLPDSDEIPMSRRTQDTARYEDYPREYEAVTLFGHLPGSSSIINVTSRSTTPKWLFSVLPSRYVWLAALLKAVALLSLSLTAT